MGQSRLRDGGTTVSLADLTRSRVGFGSIHIRRAAVILIDRHVLIPFDERRVRDVPESAATEEGETHIWAKNASKHAWSRSEIP